MVYKHMVPLNIKTTQAPCVQGISHSMNSLSQTNNLLFRTKYFTDN